MIKNQTNTTLSGIGRKKESTAIVSLLQLDPNNPKNEAKFEVNGRFGKDYFQQNFRYLSTIYLPLKLINLENNYDIIVKVAGGGLTGQADSIKLGIARAICKLENINYRSSLKLKGLLKRDARVKERRKYGLKKARKASQYSKR